LTNGHKSLGGVVMCLNNIVFSISKSIYDEFGERYCIYSEEVKQGISLPCFFIIPIKYSQSAITSNYIKMINEFDIQFLPEQNLNTKNKDIITVCSKIIKCLKYIDIDGKLFKGTNIYSYLKDDTLHLSVNYNFFAAPDIDKYYMQNLTQKGSVKNG